MKRAIQLAAKGRGAVAPNPMVGAVIVRDGRVIGEGWHTRYGCAHAEVEALNAATESPRGSTMYVSLEPCSHFGKTPPCANALVDAGVVRVVAAMGDPNPKVAGKGFQILRDAGIDVEVGLLEDEARTLNEIFLKFITTKLPYVILKAAVSLDGKIATVSGESQWISNADSRADAHALRAEVDAVLVGVNTVLADDPKLTSRIPDAPKQPYRIALDCALRTPRDSNLCKLAVDGKTIVATLDTASPEMRVPLEKAGVNIISFQPDGEGHVPIVDLLAKLAEMKIASVLVEGGATISAAFLAAKAVDRLVLYVAPKILGGQDALSFVGGKGFPTIASSSRLESMDVSRIGNDLKITGRVVYGE